MTTLVASNAAKSRLNGLRSQGMAAMTALVFTEVKRPERMRQKKRQSVVAHPGDGIGQATLERMQHGGDLMLIGDRGKFRQRITSPVDKLIQHFHEDEWATIELFRDVYAMAEQLCVTAPYTGEKIDGSGGSGLATERQRRAMRITKQVLDAVPPQALPIVYEMLLDIPTGGKAKPRKPHVLARDYTAWKEESRLRGVSIGLLKSVVWLIQKHLKEATLRTA